MRRMGDTLVALWRFRWAVWEGFRAYPELALFLALVLVVIALVGVGCRG